VPKRKEIDQKRSRGKTTTKMATAPDRVEKKTAQNIKTKGVINKYNWLDQTHENQKEDSTHKREGKSLTEGGSVTANHGGRRTNTTVENKAEKIEKHYKEKGGHETRSFWA